MRQKYYHWKMNALISHAVGDRMGVEMAARLIGAVLFGRVR